MLVLLKPAPEIGRIAIDLVSRDPGSRQTGRECALQHLSGQLRFGGKRHLLGNARFLSSLRVIHPVLGQIEPSIQEGPAFAAGVAEEDADLAVLASSRGATVLPLHPDRLPPLFQKAGLIDDEHPILLSEVLNHIRPEVIAHRIRVPVCGIEQPLHPLRTGLAQVFGELPAVLALNPIQQSCQVALGSISCFRSPEPASNPRMEVIQSCTPALNRRPLYLLVRRHGPLRSVEGYQDYTLSVAVVLDNTSRVGSVECVSSTEPGASYKARR